MLLFIAVPAHVRTDQLEVSIHLMLLFILDTQLRGPQGPWFQYISCYSLSEDVRERD